MPRQSSRSATITALFPSAVTALEIDAVVSEAERFGDRPEGRIRPDPDRRPEDDALIVYTSGTTGAPKGAVHTHASLLAGVTSLVGAWEWEPADRLLLCLPLFHVHGLCAGLFGALTAGASAAVYRPLRRIGRPRLGPGVQHVLRRPDDVPPPRRHGSGTRARRDCVCVFRGRRHWRRTSGAAWRQTASRSSSATA